MVGSVGAVRNVRVHVFRLGDVRMVEIEKRFEMMNERINQLEDQLARFEAKTGFMDADTMREKGLAWIARNPRAWRYLKRMAHYSVTNQSRFSIQKELETLRETEINMGDDEYKVANSYGALLARELCDEMPELRELVTLRPSKLDRFYKWRSR